MAFNAVVQIGDVFDAPHILFVFRLIKGAEKLLGDHGLPLAIIAHREIDESVLGLVNGNRSKKFVGVAATGNTFSQKRPSS